MIDMLFYNHPFYAIQPNGWLRAVSLHESSVHRREVRPSFHPVRRRPWAAHTESARPLLYVPSAWGEVVLWRFEFYCTGRGITESVKVASESERLGLEEVIQQVQSMMSIVTFAFGKADRCLVTSDDGTIVKEVVSYARTH
jgi:hypothetical protein